VRLNLSQDHLRWLRDNYLKRCGFSKEEIDEIIETEE